MISTYALMGKEGTFKMSASISAYPADQRVAVILRRLKQTEKGCGFYAAVDALKAVVRGAAQVPGLNQSQARELLKAVNP